MKFSRFKYFWRLTIKLASFLFFGISCAILVCIGFPLIRAFVCFRHKDLERSLRRFNKTYFSFFVRLMEFSGGISVHIENKERLLNLRSNVVVANHPSLLDVVILFSIIPNADCIVKGELLKKRFVSKIIKNLYITNSMPFEEQLKAAMHSMQKGNNLIVFPEGTRSLPHAPLDLKKGAARFALYAKRDITPVYFGGNEKIGLRKGDSILSFHPTMRYIYSLKVLNVIHVNAYKDLPISKGAKLLTEQMKATFETELNKPTP